MVIRRNLQPKSGIRIRLMADLVNFLTSIPATVKFVGHIDHKRIPVSDVPVAMHHPRRNGHEHGIGLTDLMHFISFRQARPVLPKMKLIRAVEEDKPVRLGSMLVRAPGNSWVSHREVAHRRIEAIGKGVVAVELDKPTSRVFVPLQRLKKDA